jgi:hypothetical protein
MTASSDLSAMAIITIEPPPSSFAGVRGDRTCSDNFLLSRFADLKSMTSDGGSTTPSSSIGVPFPRPPRGV